uniref:Putative secreted protein n=1 Tax=Ixodes ricinus TaxID=34613 RepID=A0A6B0UXS9_IXORI
MASRAVVCCLSWQWTDTDSYPAVCCDRWSWERLARQEPLFLRPPCEPWPPSLMHHRRITAFYQRTFSPCRVAHFSPHIEDAHKRNVLHFCKLGSRWLLSFLLCRHSSTHRSREPSTAQTAEPTSCPSTSKHRVHFCGHPLHTHTHFSTSDDHCTPIGAPFAQHSTDQ